MHDKTIRTQPLKARNNMHGIKEIRLVLPEQLHLVIKKAAERANKTLKQFILDAIDKEIKGK